jgi:hypothetical protein
VLRCQNQDHFLIIHRALFGVSEWDPRSRVDSLCTQELFPAREQRLFACTGSKLCVFSPRTAAPPLSACHNATANLTLLHVACAGREQLGLYVRARGSGARRRDHQVKTIASLDSSGKGLSVPCAGGSKIQSPISVATKN